MPLRHGAVARMNIAAGAMTDRVGQGRWDMKERVGEGEKAPGRP